MNKEEMMKEIEHIANCELYDTIGVKYLKGNIEKLFEENKQLKERVYKAVEYIKNHKETREHYEPYGTPMGNSNYITTHVFGYYELIEILKGGNNE